MPDLKVVAITGSYGKTSTKDILYTLLWKKYYVVKTPKSFNTPLGVSQTILEDVKANTDIFIAEVGAYKKGEIKKIANLITPQIGIITAIAPQHLERFKTIENIAYAKFELVESLPKNGLAILNSASEWLKKLWPNSPCTVSFYGYDSDYKVQNIKLSLSGTSFQLLTPKGKADINIPLIGEHHAYNFLAAAVAALKLGISLDEIKSRAGLLLPTPHRMEIKSLGNITLIDNSFNSNSESAKSSLSLLGSFDDTKKIVVTPGFVELGKESSVRNRAFGEDIAKVADEIIIVGENAKEDLLRGVQKVFRSEETIHFAASTQDALVLAQQLMQGTKGVVLLENDLPDQYN
ncbi:UDP-N-acetylmuramoyl-tripeptide--D-alanyl-D-alanine ligase [Candidatus Daviesbacteria bacterium]|nr:UDP-N-acetylmuramoyl-tripeptide--D-alanyl-D-alanine ligase [Candidatus Daviesbacteria bacterium]